MRLNNSLRMICFSLSFSILFCVVLIYFCGHTACCTFSYSSVISSLDYSKKQNKYIGFINVSKALFYYMESSIDMNGVLIKTVDSNNNTIQSL